MIDAELGHVGEVGARQAGANHLQGPPGRGRIACQMQMPVRQPMQRDGKLGRRRPGLVADFQDGLLGLGQVVEVVGIQVGQHHPAVKIVFAFLEFVDDLPLGLGVFAELHTGDGAGINGGRFPGARIGPAVAGHRREQDDGCQAKQRPAAEKTEPSAGIIMRDQTGQAERLELVAGVAFGASPASTRAQASVTAVQKEQMTKRPAATTRR